MRHYLLGAPLNWGKVISKFLQFANHHTHVEVTFNRGVRLGLEIAVKYFLRR